MNNKLISLYSIIYLVVMFIFIALLKLYLIIDISYNQLFLLYFILIMAPLLIMLIIVGLSFKKYFIVMHNDKYNKLTYVKLTDTYSFNTSKMVKFILFSEECYGDKQFKVLKENHKIVYFLVPISFICYVIISIILYV